MNCKELRSCGDLINVLSWGMWGVCVCVCVHAYVCMCLYVCVCVHAYVCVCVYAWFLFPQIPTFLKARLDYRVYHPGIVFENNFWGTNEVSVWVLSLSSSFSLAAPATFYAELTLRSKLYIISSSISPCEVVSLSSPIQIQLTHSEFGMSVNIADV